MKIKKLEAKIEIPKDVQVEIDKNIIKIKGPKGEVEKKFMIPGLALSKQDSEIILSSESGSKRGKRIINSHRANLRNMINLKIPSNLFSFHKIVWRTYMTEHNNTQHDNREKLWELIKKS